MDGQERLVKSWYCGRNVFIAVAVVVVVVLGWAFSETAKVYHGEPNVAVDYRSDFRRYAERTSARGTGRRSGKLFVRR